MRRAMPLRPAATRPISASALIHAPLGDVFGLLIEPEAHHRLAGRQVRILELKRDDEHGMRGELVLCGPLRLRRRATTQVRWTRAPWLLAGPVQLGERTRAIVRWQLEPRGPRVTQVELSAHPGATSTADRLLLRVGARRWVENLFTDTLGRLSSALADPDEGELAWPPARHGSAQRLQA